MAYMRGDNYIYEDMDGNIHFHTEKGSLQVPIAIFDELVVMRYADLEEDKTVKKIEKRAIRKWSGNIGAEALRKKNGKKSIFDELLKDKA